MLVSLNQTMTLAASQEEAWSLLRDTKRRAGLIPGVEGIESEYGESSGTNGMVPQEKHVANVVERVGPFRLNLKLAVTIVKAVEPFLIEAELNGADAKSQNRLSGTLRAMLVQDHPTETRLSVDASVEVMGKLAALGASPIRRRAKELFDQFTERLQSQFSAAGAAEAAEGGSAA
ncbi:MAG: CoxG family protein [Terriglobia bacterium]